MEQTTEEKLAKLEQELKIVQRQLELVTLIDEINNPKKPLTLRHTPLEHWSVLPIPARNQASEEKTGR